MKKSALALAAALVIMLKTVTAAASGVQLEIRPPGGPIEKGGTFQVTAELSGNPGFTSAQFVLAFDSDRLECTEVSAGSLLENTLWASNPTASGGAAVAAAASQAVEGDGTLAVFRFRAREDLPSPAFRVQSLVLTGEDGEKLSCTVTGAQTSDKPEASASENTSGGGSKNSPGGNSPSMPGGSSGSTSGTHSGNTSGGGKSNTSAPSPVTNTLSPATNTPSSTTDTPSPVTNTPSPFTDTAGTWAEQEIAAASRRGLFHGYPDGTFRPQNPVTRGQYVLVLWNLAGRPAPRSDTPFRDTSGLGQEFRDAIAWAYEKGLVQGTAPDRFSPAAPLTRQAAVKILFGYSGGVSGQELMLINAYNSLFSDSGTIPSWARDGMYWAVYNGILKGTTPSTLSPAAGLTRAQLAAVMVRYTDSFPAAQP